MIVLGIVLLTPPPPEIGTSGFVASGVFLVTVLLWLTRAVPYVVSSVLAVMLLYALGVVDSIEAAASGFSSSLVFFLILLLLLGNTIQEVDLDARLAGRLLRAEGSPSRALSSLTKALLALAVFMPSAAARTVTLFPVVERIRSSFDLPPDSEFARTAYLVLGQVNPLASVGLMTGGGMAVVTAGFIHSLVGPLTWVEWAVYMVPPAATLYVLGAVAVFWLHAPNDAGTDPTEKPTDEPEFDRDQRIVALVMAGTVLAWVLGSFLGVPTILPAAAAVVVLALPGIGIIRADAISEISWNVVFLVAAMFSLLDVLTTTGVIESVIAGTLDAVPLHALPVPVSIGVLLLFAFAVRIVFSTGSAALLVVLPFALRIGSELGVDQLHLSFALLIVVGGTTVLPFNTTSALLAYEEGPLTQRDVARFGAVTLLLSFAVAGAAWLLYWPLVSSV